MNEMLISWIVSLIAGSAGGNVVGALLKNKSLGPMLNTVLGIAGGAIGGQVLGNVEAIKNIVSSLGATGSNAGLSAVVGALLPLIVSFLKKPAAA